MGTKVSLLPSEVDLAIMRGTDHTLTFVLTSGEDAKGNPIPVNIAADSVRLTIRSDDGKQALASTNAPGQHTAPTEGRTAFGLSRVLTQTLPADAIARWTYEVRRIVGGNANEIVHVRGTLEIHP